MAHRFFFTLVGMVAADGLAPVADIDWSMDTGSSQDNVN